MPSADPVLCAIDREASTGSHVAIEQFDASAVAAAGRFRRRVARAGVQPAHRACGGGGSASGESCGADTVQAAAPDRVEDAAATLHLEGESPLTYFPRGSRLTVRMRWPNRADARYSTTTFLWTCRSRIRSTAARSCSRPIRCTSPAERSRRSADRRHLGLRIFKAELRAAKRPGFLARHSSELPNGASNARSQSASSCITAVMHRVDGRRRNGDFAAPRPPARCAGRAGAGAPARWPAQGTAWRSCRSGARSGSPSRSSRLRRSARL